MKNLCKAFCDMFSELNHKLSMVSWKNNRAAPGTAYIPTEIEHLANIFTHGIIIVPALLAAVHLYEASKSSTHSVAALIYGSALTLLFLISTVFHSIFYCNRNRYLKDVLHRCDRAMIYVFIAGSYFPWLHLGHSKHQSIFNTLQYGVWILAAMGILYQQMYHERYKSLETIFYVLTGIGPSLVVMFCGHDFAGMAELKIGGILYIIGIYFFKADGTIPCAHAIWHVFVVMAAFVHYYAILKYLFDTSNSTSVD